MMLPRISAVLLFSEVSAVDWVSSVGWSADLGAGVAGSCFFFYVYRILLTVAGQMRSWVSTTSDADQV